MSLDRTPQLVQDRTGVAGITVAQIATARGIISAVVGYDLSETPLPAFRAADLKRLEAAVDWQAVYVSKNPDLATRAGNLTSAGANGVSVGYDSSGSAGAILSPLARYSVNRLSWRRSRSIRMKRVEDNPTRPQTLVNDGDPAEWKPLR